jgi:iron complex transport system substrate-binding protein
MKYLVALLVQCVAFAFPLTLTDDAGRSVALSQAPGRIVTLLPSATETICALSEASCKRVVATDEFSNWPESVRKLPKAGGYLNPNPELIVSLKPDLVILGPGKLAETLQRAGLRVYVSDTQSYADIFRSARAFGQILGASAQAERLVARIQSEVFALERAAAKAISFPSVYYEIDPTPYSVGPQSFIGVLITKARGNNIVPSAMGAFPQVAPEMVLQKNPAVIVLTHPGKLQERPGWTKIDALKNNRICVFGDTDNDLLSRPGPRVAEGLKLLLKCFHPEVK